MPARISSPLSDAEQRERGQPADGGVGVEPGGGEHAELDGGAGRVAAGQAVGDRVAGQPGGDHGEPARAQRRQPRPGAQHRDEAGQHEIEGRAGYRDGQRSLDDGLPGQRVRLRGVDRGGLRRDRGGLPGVGRLAAGSTALTAPLGAASGLAPDTALIPASSLSPPHLVHHSPFGEKDLPAERAAFHGRPQGLTQRPGMAARWPAQVPATPLSPTSPGPCRVLIPARHPSGQTALMTSFAATYHQVSAGGDCPDVTSHPSTHLSTMGWPGAGHPRSSGHRQPPGPPPRLRRGHIGRSPPQRRRWPRPAQPAARRP